MHDSPWRNDEHARRSLDIWDERVSGIAIAEVETIIAHCRLAPGATVLDLGCGSGRHATELARRGYAVTGVDISPVMLTAARTRLAEAQVVASLVEGSLVDWAPEQLGTADAVLCLHESGFGTLGGHDADAAFLGRVHGWLRPGGCFVLSTLNAIRRYRNPSPAFDHVNGVVHWQAPLADGQILREDIRVYTPAELTLLLEQAGFGDVLVGPPLIEFDRRSLQVDDVELTVLCRK